jgi:predicted component of type VI protein secretion system
MLHPASEAVQQTTALTPNDSATAEEPEAPAAQAPAEPEPMIEEEPAAAIEPPAVEEPNMFEEVEHAGGPTAPIDEVTPFPADAPLSDAPLSDAAAPPMPEPPAADNAPEPASEEPAADEPATEDPFDAAGANEPVRRWIDRTGGYAVVGTLVAVGEDGTCELAAAGRRLRVSIEALSDHDRDYARQATTRLTAGPAGKPATGDTAGL